MSALQIDSHLIKLMGRWGSQAVDRYIDQAPTIHNVLTGASSIGNDDRTDLFQDLKKEIEAIKTMITSSSARYVVNRAPSGRVGRIHLRRDADLRLQQPSQPKDWRAVCGWEYGVKEIDLIPEFYSLLEKGSHCLCKKCFRVQQAADSSSSDSDSSSSSDSDQESADEIEDFSD